MANTKKKTGRPTLYSEALADKICNLIAQGFSERQISKMDGMPDAFTIRRWKDKYEDFCARTVRAREISAEVWDDRREEKNNDMMAYVLKCMTEGDEVDPGVIRAFDIHLRELARSAANRNDALFGDRKKVSLTGANNGPVKIDTEVKKLSAEELLAIANLKMDEEAS